MQDGAFPATRDLVLVGGGHTHALILKKWGMNPLPGTRVTVINPSAAAPYSGMLPGHLAGHYARADLDIDLVKLARYAKARIIIDAATAIDSAQRKIHLQSGRYIEFDVASIDVGITSEMPQISGFAEHAVAAKPLGPFAEKWRAALNDSSVTSIGIIGGGVAGAEIAMAFAHARRSRSIPTDVHLIDRNAILDALPERAAHRIRGALQQAGITLHEHHAVTAITATHIVTDQGDIPAHFTCGAAGAKPHDWLKTSGLPLHNGFVEVGPTLETPIQGIFAVGDCAHMVHAPRPKAGVYAVRQAPTLYENLRARLADTPPQRRYKPQSDYLKLVSLGGKSALGDRFGMAFSGAWVWKWKNHIDQTFMNQFRDLPKMKTPDLPTAHAAGLDELMQGKPLCGGCGAKVGQPALLQALQSQTPGDDAAIVPLGGKEIVISTDHLRGMVNDATVMTELAAHHALGDIWAMGAQPFAATANVVIPRASDRIAARQLDEIMRAARKVMTAAGADIVGGHSSQGAELTIGFTILGRAPAAPITLAGAQSGDRLILTKPIGSGVLMAAEMQGAADGQDIAAALALMTQSQQAAAELLSHAHAMTDVTGFGLLGHLRNICVTSGVAARLRVDAVPLMQGAEALAQAGIRSSLYPANRQIMPDLPAGARFDLMLDPQTAGGLLAALPADDGATLQRLRAAGYHAAEIGEITAAADQTPPVTLA